MSDRVAAMMAEIEAKQREVERIIAEETKKNIVPPLIEVLEEEIEDSTETERIAANLVHHFKRYEDAEPRHIRTGGTMATTPDPIALASLAATAHTDARNLQGTVAEMRNELTSGRIKEDRGRCVNERTVMEVKADYFEAHAMRHEHNGKMFDKKVSRPCLLLRAQLDAAKKDAEWKIQSFKIIDALTQRVAALEARLDAKETVPLGTPVLGSDPDSGEDSVEDTYEGSSSHESTRRTLFPYW